MSTPKYILFVCTGNICRSPMAEALLRHMLKAQKIDEIEVFSRGVYAERGSSMTDLALASLDQQSVDGRQHRAAQLSQKDMDRADLVLVMEQDHKDWIEVRFPDAMDKTHLLKEYVGMEDEDLEVADPYGGSPAVYEKCRMEIQNCLLDLLTKIKHPKGN